MPRSFEQVSSDYSLKREAAGLPPESESALKKFYQSYLTVVGWSGSDDVEIKIEQRKDGPTKTIFVPQKN